MQDYLRTTDTIDWNDPQIQAVARSLSIPQDPVETASRCFYWVRDEITHSFDVNAQCVSCTASETLKNRTGICYAKSHLLAALLRANRVPDGFGYQRISLDEDANAFCLHGFNFVFLPALGWYAIDPRGNRDGIATYFNPPKVSLAFENRLPGEETLSTVFADPLPSVESCLRTSRSLSSLREALPDKNA